MASLGLRLNPDDAALLARRLSDESDIAQIRSDGPGRWRAHHDVVLDPSGHGHYSLLHVPSGPLPLEPADQGDPTPIENPFDGWAELQPSPDPLVPYFGTTSQCDITMKINTRWHPEHGMSRSTIGWIGNRFAAIHGPAPEGVERWWARLGRWVKKNAAYGEKVPGYTMRVFPGASTEMAAWSDDPAMIPQDRLGSIYHVNGPWREYGN